MEGQRGGVSSAWREILSQAFLAHTHRGRRDHDVVRRAAGQVGRESAEPMADLYVGEGVRRTVMSHRLFRVLEPDDGVLCRCLSLERDNDILPPVPVHVAKG